MSFQIDVPIPSMGATVNEMTLIDLEIEIGQVIAKGEKLAELESDKSVFDFESPCDGTVMAIHCRAGDILEVGAPFVRIQTEDGSVTHLQVEAGAAAQGAAATEAAAAAVLQEVAPSPARPAAPPAAVTQANGVRWTPRAKKRAAELGLDPERLTDIVGSGPGGRVTGDDLDAYVPAASSASEAAVTASRSSARVSPPKGRC